MPTYQDDPVISKNTKENPVFNGGVLGESTLFNGVLGVTYAPERAAVSGINNNDNKTLNQPAGPGVYGSSKGTGVHGDSETWNGVAGISKSTIGGAGVYGESVGAGVGVIGKSQTWHGIYGETNSTTGGAGVWGEHKANGAGVGGKSDSGNGGWFESTQGEGVRGWSKNPNHGGVVGVNTAKGIGVYGQSDDGIGVWGSSKTFEGVHAETYSKSTAAMAAYQMEPTSDTAALYAKHAGNRTAAVFEGNVIVTGDVMLANADCAEHFDIAEATLVEPGTVMVLGEEEVLLPSHQAYDKRVAGVISGAGNYKPGIVLDKQESQKRRLPVALLGKVFCKVDAQFGAIEVGDLLTTSSTLGHAMKADDPAKAFGSVIGKALRPLKKGQELIPILIALQ
jgi:hypothetical protein